MQSIIKERNVIEESGINKIKSSTNIIINIIMMILTLISIIPFVFVLIISLSDEKTIQHSGYSFFPKQWSFNAYIYLLNSGGQLLKSYGVTILVTILGTVIGLLLISSYSYVLSRKSFAFRGFFTKLAFIPMLFSGGMVSSYLVMVKFLGLKNTIWALILPIAMNTWYVIILRTFFKTTVPESIIESAKIDGASEFFIFFRIVLPISLPGIATIALFLSLGYWNDWFNAMMYIDRENLIPLQYMLIRIENSMEFLTSHAASMGSNGITAAANLPKETAKMAIVFLSTLPIVFAYPFFQKYFISGLTIGAVKE